MKKVVFSLMALLCLSACSTDLSEIEDRIAAIEQQGKDLDKTSKDLKKQGDDLKAEGDKLKSESEALAEDGKKLQDEINGTQDKINSLEEELKRVVPQLLSMEFRASDNPMQLVENAKCEMAEGNVVECWIPNVMNTKKLIPRFEYKGDKVTVGGTQVESGVTQVDFSEPVVLTVSTAKESKSYTVNVHAYTGLPTLWVLTYNRENIAVGERYYSAQMKLTEDVSTRAAGSVIEANVRIKGVGSTIWQTPRVTGVGTPLRELGKNPYEIQFSSAVSLLDEPKNKAWLLVTNSEDLTMLRSQTAYYMGRISNLDYTPKFHFVDMMMNGRYFGTYMMGDKVEVGSSRVNVGSDGFLLKIDTRASGAHFNVKYIGSPISVVAPWVQAGDANYDYISSFLANAENALYSENFTNAASGWQKYLDMDSFVDWYLINEIAKNGNALFQADCYMHLKRGGKLKMGPLWNFEGAFGNTGSTATGGFVVKNADWFARLFRDPAFVAKVKERFGYFYKHQNAILSDINGNAQYLRYSVRENDNKWDTFDPYKSSYSNTGLLYENAVGSMKKWLIARMAWLKGEFDKM